MKYIMKHENICIFTVDMNCCVSCSPLVVLAVEQAVENLGQ